MSFLTRPGLVSLKSRFSPSRATKSSRNLKTATCPANHRQSSPIEVASKSSQAPLKHIGIVRLLKCDHHQDEVARLPEGTCLKYCIRNRLPLAVTGDGLVVWDRETRLSTNVWSTHDLCDGFYISAIESIGHIVYLANANEAGPTQSVSTQKQARLYRI